jgi:hypothetical protein
VKLPTTTIRGTDYGTKAGITLYARDYLVSEHTLTVKVKTATGALYTRDLKFTVTR